MKKKSPKSPPAEAASRPQADLPKLPEPKGSELPAPSSIRLISKAELLEKIGVTFPTIWGWMRAGTFPRCRRLGDGTKIAWIEAEVEQWILAQPQQRYLGDPRQISANEEKREQR